MPLNREEKNALRILSVVATITFIVGLILGGIIAALITLSVTR